MSGGAGGAVETTCGSPDRPARRLGLRRRRPARRGAAEIWMWISDLRDIHACEIIAVRCSCSHCPVKLGPSVPTPA